MSPRISAVVNTLNEEVNIDFCLRSLRPWCDEIIVVDMFSDDRTADMARRHADVVLQHERVGFVEPARAMGLAAATGDWIILVDADEVATPELASWIRHFVDGNPPYDLVLLPRANVFLGRWLRSTRWWPGKPRLFRPGALDVASEIHRGLRPRAGARVAKCPRDPKISLWHFSRTSLHVLSEKTNHYTTIEARQANAAGRGDPRGLQFFGAAVRVFALYVWRRGYRDGVAGLAYVFDRAYYKFLVKAKRWDEARAGHRQARYDRWREQILAGFEGWDGHRPDVEGTHPATEPRD